MHCDSAVRRCSVAVLLSSALAVGAGAAEYRVESLDTGGGAPRSGLLRLQYGTFDPRAAEAGARALAPAVKATRTESYIVQFTLAPGEEQRRVLASLGARLFHFVPDDAYIVHMNAATRARVAARSDVRWVGAYEPAYKLEPSLVEALAAPAAAGRALPRQRYSILVLEKGARMKQAVARAIRRMGGVVHEADAGGHALEASLSPDQLLALARRDEILYIDRWFAPESDMDNAREISGANFLQGIAGYTGQGVRGEVMDGGLLTTHQDFRARPPILHGSNSTSVGHGTATYGQVFGTGAGSASARGVLPDAQGIFARHAGNRYNHTRDLVDPARSFRAVFQSNSWGSGLTTSYTSTSAQLDDIAFDHDFLIVQSQSNNGTRNSRPQAWAKNVISVGGVRHRNTLTKADDGWGGGASIGPAADGRIKPDLCHFYDGIRTTAGSGDTAYTNGFGGTSGATPIVAGYAGLMFQMWADGVFAGRTGQRRDVFTTRPHMSTAKALLINSAAQYPFSGAGHDLTRVHQGWGMVDVKALYELARGQGFRLPLLVDESAVIRAREMHTYTLNLAGRAPLRVTMVYSDPMGSPSAARARVNDLSLKVTGPDGAVYWGNNGLLQGVWSTPGGSANTVDTVENVFVQNATGRWTIQVLASEIVQDGHTETGGLDADYALVATTTAPITR